MKHGDLAMVVYNANDETVQFYLNGIPNSIPFKILPTPYPYKQKLRFVVMMFHLSDTATLH